MATIVTRSGKGSELTFVEMDANFTNINSDKIELTNLSVTDSGGDGSLAYNNSTGVITYTGPSASDVRAHFSAGEGIDISSGEISGEDASTSNKGIASFDTDHFTVSSGAVTLKTDGIDDTLIDFGTGTNQVSSADVPEQTNLYYTDARARASISASGSLSYNSSTGALTYTQGNTDTVSEGSSNLYYTAERVDDQVNTLLTEGSNITLTYDDAAGTLTVAASGTVTTINNNADNRVITGSGTANTLNGEANMTFDGSNAVISGSAGGITSPVLELETDNSGWNRPALMFKDSNDDTISVVGENNTTYNSYVYNFTFDPNNTKGRTGVTTWAGDYFVAFAKNYNDQAEISIDQNVYGAHAGYNLTVLDDFNSNSPKYTAKPINLKGNEVNLFSSDSTTPFGSFTKELSVTSSGVKIENNTLDLDGQDLTMGGGDIDMEGGDLKDSSGVLKIADLSEQIVVSGGTVTYNLENKSATGSGLRITGGEDGATTHTDGELFMVRRGLASGGYDEIIEARTSSSASEVLIKASSVEINNPTLTGATVDTGTSFTQSNRLQITINGTNYFIPLDAV